MNRWESKGAQPPSLSCQGQLAGTASKQAAQCPSRSNLRCVNWCLFYFKLLTELACLLLLAANQAVDQGQPQQRQRESEKRWVGLQNSILGQKKHRAWAPHSAGSPKNRRQEWKGKRLLRALLIARYCANWFMSIMSSNPHTRDSQYYHDFQHTEEDTQVQSGPEAFQWIINRQAWILTSWSTLEVYFIHYSNTWFPVFSE